MSQQSLFHESMAAALGTDIMALGGFLEVAKKLWPAMPDATRAAKLRASLNPDQPHKLDMEEVLAIKRWARDVNSYATINFEAQQLSYRVEWIEPQDELTALMRDVSDDYKRIEARQKRIERLLERQPLKSVR